MVAPGFRFRDALASLETWVGGFEAPGTSLERHWWPHHMGDSTVFSFNGIQHRSSRRGRSTHAHGGSPEQFLQQSRAPPMT